MFPTKNAETGTITCLELELVRLAILRRVYTMMHMNYVAESIIEIFKNRERIKGLRLVYEAPICVISPLDWRSSHDPCRAL